MDQNKDQLVVHCLHMPTNQPVILDISQDVDRAWKLMEIAIDVLGDEWTVSLTPLSFALDAFFREPEGAKVAPNVG